MFIYTTTQNIYENVFPYDTDNHLFYLKKLMT